MDVSDFSFFMALRETADWRMRLLYCGGLMIPLAISYAMVRSIMN